MQVSPITMNGYQFLDSNCPDSEQLHVCSGNLVRRINLFTIPTVGKSLSFTLYHNSRNITPAADVGVGWRHNVQAQLNREDGSATLVEFIDETGRQRDFELIDDNWVLKDNSLFENFTLTQAGEGMWMLVSEPDGKTMHFQELPGTPIVARLSRMTNNSDNAIEYVFDGTELNQILEPSSGRAISIEWTSGKISAVEDPAGNRFELSYEGDQLTSLEMPGGCLVDFTYHEDDRVASRASGGVSTLYTYDEDGRLLQIEGPLEGGVRPTATWEYSSEPVHEVANLSPVSSPGTGEFIELSQVFFTTARGKVWEYRFLPSSMLWREISPLGHHRRYFYDDRQNLLGSSEGYERKNLDDTSDTANHEHPRDNINNLFRYFAWDEKGNLLQEMDANGMVTTRTYGDNSLPLTVYPGQAHYGLGGNWQEHFGAHGILFCAYESNGDDLQDLPAYVSAVTPGGDVVAVHSDFDAENSALLSTQVLEGVEGPRRSVGRWTSDEQSMDFQIELSDEQAFNLSLYTNSLDQLAGTGNALDYPEFFGRDIEFTVTDMRGSQSFHVTQNASGVWVTFPVVGDETHPIVVTAVCPQSEHRPTVSALAFDPFEDRRIQMVYGPDGFLSKVIEPTSDPGREVADVYEFNMDGTISEVSKTYVQDGVLVDSRTSKMFYGDSARNLTRVEDPLNQAEAPTLMEYDSVGNMIHLVDPDEKEMFFEYDYRRRLTKVTNGLSQRTLMTFDGRGLLTGVKDAKDRETLFSYTPARQLWKITNALNEVTEFSYYADGLLKKIKDAAGNEVEYSYSDDDQLIQVVYPETEVVLPDFSRVNLSPQLRMAYDVWDRLAAVTSPNGNLDDTATINLIGALNLLRNGGAEYENGVANQVPTAWEEDRPAGFAANSVRSSADKLAGDYSFPLSVPSSLGSGESHDWVQRRPGGSPGGRYLMKGSAKSNLATNFKLRAVVREFSGALSEQTGEVALTANTWTEATGRLDVPGDGQVTPKMPALHQFRAGIEKPASGTAQAYLDQLQVLALSQVSHYGGEYATGSTGADGAKMRVLRDRYGRVRRIIDPVGRTVEFKMDVLDRILEVKDSQGLTLRYEWDFLGNLVKFTDSREQETLFALDALDRVVQITQPDTDQFELFTYTPAGDLASYTNCRDQRREFTYDLAHRLTQIDYIMDPDPNESVVMTYDAVGNLLTLTERNGDQLVMTYDVLNRLKGTARKSVDGPKWALVNEFDSRGNRTKLQRAAVYGQGEYAEAAYGGGSAIFTAHFNALNQMDSLKDSMDNETTFAFDADSRLAEVNHPVEDLQTRYRYDLVGKLLETRVALDSEELWNLSYDYNLAGERLRQVSRWADGGNCFEYRLDSSGRLIQETINRFVVNSLEGWAAGSQRQTCFDPDAKVSLVKRADDFQAAYLDLQRWELSFSEPVATGVRVRQDQGLSWASSVGETHRNGRHMPAGTPYDSSTALTDYPHIDPQASDTVGWFEGRMLMRHRVPLEGAFDLQVSLAQFDLFDCSIGLGVTRERFQTADGASRYPTAYGAAVDANGCDVVVQNDGGFQVKFNGTALTDVTPTRLRLKRFLDGVDWKLEAYYHDGSTWVTDASWTEDFSGQKVFAYLHLSGKVGHLQWSNFLDATGPDFLVSTVDGDQSVNQGAWPCYESRVYDAGFSADWTRLAWTETLPSNTDIRFQVAVSEDSAGPWSYVGSAGTSTSYFSTAAGETLTGLTGRYCRFRAFLYSTDGVGTPELSEVQLTHSGTSGSRFTTWTYDEAGNITEQVRVTDAGTETDEREYNNLNQLETSFGGWTYQYDPDGNLIGKDNGELGGCEKWEFAWSDESRLMQVKKGVYDVTPTLVNEFTVEYTYDSMGRMLTRDDGTDLTTFTWHGWDCVKEVTGESETVYHIPQGAILSFVRDGVTYQAHSDALGSIRMITDEAGEVVARYDFDAFGNELPGSFDSVPGGMPYKFVGGLGCRTDLTTSLVYMRQRWYDPSVGRFISRDPIGLSGGDNLYGYCANSPINFSDPQGLDPTGGYLDAAAGAARRTASRVPIYTADKIKGYNLEEGGGATIMIDGVPSIVLNSKLPSSDVPQVIAHELVHYILMVIRKKKKKKGKKPPCRDSKAINDEEDIAYRVQAVVDMIYSTTNRNVDLRNRTIRNLAVFGTEEELSDYIIDKSGGAKRAYAELVRAGADRNRDGVSDGWEAAQTPDVNLPRSSIVNLRRYPIL